jgi:hypothetical protein
VLSAPHRELERQGRGGDLSATRRLPPRLRAAQHRALERVRGLILETA